MNRTEKKKILEGLESLAKENFLEWADKFSKSSTARQSLCIETLVETWNLYCEDTMCYNEGIYVLQNDESFIKDLQRCDSNRINLLCNQRIDGIKYSWEHKNNIIEVDPVVLIESIENEFTGIFYYMLMYPETWGKTNFWKICFTEEDCELIAR